MSRIQIPSDARTPWPETLRNLGSRRLLHLAGCALAVSMLLVGCPSPDSKSGDVDANNPQDDGGMEDAIGPDSTMEDLDGGDIPDTAVPGGTGVEDCVKACETFLMTNCSTPAADFCESAQQNCEARYATHSNCQAELEAMDACAAAQPVANFSCPLGTVPNEAAPYNLTEDVCVSEAYAVNVCLGAG